MIKLPLCWDSALFELDDKLVADRPELGLCVAAILHSQFSQGTFEVLSVRLRHGLKESDMASVSLFAEHYTTMGFSLLGMTKLSRYHHQSVRPIGVLVFIKRTGP
jgi:hypothetical protein